MPDPQRVVDLRSDTVTRPSAEMRRAIAEAEVGDAVLGDDPTVEALETLAAEMLGKERALFVPSGIMANQTAILVQARRGTEVVIDAGGHILNYEEGAAAAWAGVQLRGVTTPDGLLREEDLQAAIRPRTGHGVQTSLVCLENTHNSAGGRVLPVERMRALVEVAHEAGIPVHLDGARLPNAAVAAGREMREWAALADTVMIALSKGLGAPIGSVLAGTEETIAVARQVRRRLGGGMRQAGFLAAAGIFGLERNFSLLADDHRRARRLAEIAAAIPGVTPLTPETNILMLDLAPGIDPAAVLSRLSERGVWMYQFGPRRIRAVTHLDVDDAGIERAGSALREALVGGAPPPVAGV
jgi:threonine aldolase